jgi:hypothetical protein
LIEEGFRRVFVLSSFVMELLLNLVWVLLALPAYWLWRRSAGSTVSRLGPLQCLLALGCAVVLLFPVISATDDLHAMRAEMEESASSKRTVRQAGSEKGSAWVNQLQGPPALVASATSLDIQEVRPLEVLDISLLPLVRSGVLPAGRAPPISRLG